MGGPGASILLHNALTKRQENELELWLRSITRDLKKDSLGYEFWLKEDAFPAPVSRCIFYLSVEQASAYQDDDQIRQIKEQLGYLPEQSIGVSSGCNGKDDHITLGHFILHLAEVYQGLIDMEGAITPPLKTVGRERVKELLAQSSERVKERQAYQAARWKELEASLPPGKTLRDVFIEQHSDPNSPLKAIRADVEAKFGPAVPPELSHWTNMPSLAETSAYVRAMPGTVYEIEYTASEGHRWVSHIVDRAFLQAWMKHPGFYMVK